MSALYLGQRLTSLRIDDRLVVPVQQLGIDNTQQQSQIEIRVSADDRIEIVTYDKLLHIGRGHERVAGLTYRLVRSGCRTTPPDAAARRARQVRHARRCWRAARRAVAASSGACPPAPTRRWSPSGARIPCVRQAAAALRQPRRHPRRRPERVRRAPSAHAARSLLRRPACEPSQAHGAGAGRGLHPRREVALEGLLTDGRCGAGAVRQARPARRPVLRGDDLRHALAAARRDAQAAIVARPRRACARAGAARGADARRAARQRAGRRGSWRSPARSIGGLCSSTLRFGDRACRWRS